MRKYILLTSAAAAAKKTRCMNRGSVPRITGSSRVTPHFRELFLKNDYVKTTNDFETRFSRIFLSLLELWAQFLVIHTNNQQDFDMSLNMLLPKKLRAHMGWPTVTFQIIWNKKTAKSIVFYPLGYDQTQAFSEIRNIQKMAGV